MEHSTITILDSFAIRNHGTVLCLRLDTDDSLKIGDAVELLRPDGSVFLSRVKSFQMFLGVPPPSPGTRPVVGMMLTDDPGAVPSGSTLRPAPQPTAAVDEQRVRREFESGLVRPAPHAARN